MNPGTRVGPYEVFGPLGAGGMGEALAFDGDFAAAGFIELRV